MCEHPECKVINIIEINDNGVKVVIHYNSDFEPILIQYWDDSKFYNKSFVPKHDFQFVELGKFHISMNEIKNEHFDLTEIINLDE